MADNWNVLRKWLKDDGTSWTQWAQIGDIDVDNARLVLEGFGIASTRAARARLRREVDAVEVSAPVAREP